MTMRAPFTISILCFLFMFAAPSLRSASVATSIDYGWLEANAPIVTGVDGQRYHKVDDMLFPVLNEEHTFGAAITKTALLWPNGVIYYRFTNQYVPISIDDTKKKIFLTACDDWEKGTGLCFLEGDSDTKCYIIPFEGTYNGGTIGMPQNNSSAGISIANWYTGIVAHELGHVLGLIHEHQQAGRDTYVNIISENINVGELGQFSLDPNYLPGITDYDFLSIMHYSRKAFSSNGLDTITCNTGYERFQDAIGQAAFISPLDRVGVAKLYGKPDPGLCSISVSVNDASMGGVMVGDAGSLRPFDASLLTLANPGVPLTLTARPTPITPGWPLSDYAFDYWEVSNATVGDARTATTTITPQGDCMVRACFDLNPETWKTVTFLPGEGGTIEGSTTQLIKKGGTTTEVKAIPANGYVFSHWTGDISSTSNPIVIKDVTQDIAAMAVFSSSMIHVTTGSEFELDGSIAFGRPTACFTMRDKPYLNVGGRRVFAKVLTKFGVVPTSVRIKCLWSAKVPAGEYALEIKQPHGSVSTNYRISVEPPAIKAAENENGVISIYGEFFGEKPLFSLSGRRLKAYVEFDETDGASKAVIDNPKGLHGVLIIKNGIGSAEVDI